MELLVKSWSLVIGVFKFVVDCFVNVVVESWVSFLGIIVCNCWFIYVVGWLVKCVINVKWMIWLFMIEFVVF